MGVGQEIHAARPRAPEVVDLRGTGGPAPAAVLADPTGRRAALLRTAGRVIGTLFVLWFCGLVLAGLGLLPVSDLPLAGSLGPTSEPTKLSTLPRPRPPARRDLLPAKPLARAPVTPTASPTPPAEQVTPRRSTAVAPTTQRPGRRLGASKRPAPLTDTTSTVPATAPGNSGTAPGQTRKTETTDTTTTTAPGRSGSAPGHGAVVPGNGASGR